MLTLNTFGGLSLVGPGRLIGGAAAQRRPLAVLAVLAVAGERGVSRDRLQALFWPESDPDRARKVLAQTVYAIRRDLGQPDAVLGTSELRLNPEIITADVTELECAVRSGKLERVAVLYAGPFLDGVHLTDAPEFERWADAERTRFAGLAHDVLAKLAHGAEAEGALEVAVGWWRRLAALDPLNGRIAVNLMTVLASAGDAAGALRHARVHEALLEQELGAPPDSAVRELANRLRTTGEVGGHAARTITPGPLPAFRERVESATAAEPARPRPSHHEAPRQATSDLSAPPPVASVEPDSDTGSPMAVPGARRWLPWALAAGLIAIIAVALTWTLDRGPAAPAIDEALVVVIPFDVADPELMLWREGMVDVLARNLDGAGSLRTISPTRVVREWTGRADRETVIAFGRATGAGMAVYGQLLRAGLDSVRASVTLLDVSTGQPLAELRRQAAGARMDRLTDSLTFDVLRAIGRAIPLGAVRAAPLGEGTSIEALRAFLNGERHYRHAAWDSATGHYERAVALDSSFALAWRRLGLVSSWQRLQQDSLTGAYLLRAGAANRRLGARDSLLVAADSLAAAANSTSDPIEAFALTRRHFATLDSAARAYPDDPEVWFAIGEARYHFGFGPVVGVPERATLDAFDRAISLDSAFAPAYIHAVELGFNLGGAPLGLRYARAYLARDPTDAAHRGVRLIEPLVDARAAGGADPEHLLDTASTTALVSARTILRRWPDSAETAVRLSRVLAAGRRSEYALFADTVFMRRRLAEQLAFRGHLAEAARVLGPRDAPIFAELAYLGAVSAGSARTVFARWMASASELAILAAPYWSAWRDTTSLVALGEAVRRHGAAGSDGAAASPERTARISYDTLSVAAHLALARGDTAGAVARFLALPDTLCAGCYLDRLIRAQLLGTVGRLEEALPMLNEPLVAFLTPIEVVFAIERATIAQRMGADAVADEACEFARAAWFDADRRPGDRVGAACGAET